MIQTYLSINLRLERFFDRPCFEIFIAGFELMEVEAKVVSGGLCPPAAPDMLVGEGQDDELPQRVVIPDEEKPTKEQMTVLWTEQDRYIDHLESRLKKMSSESGGGGATAASSAPASKMASKREHLLVVRLATKEQELQELSNQITELKAAQSPSTERMRNALLDPAINIIVQKLREELDATKSKLAQTNEEMSAWKFTPDSVTGKKNNH